MSLIMEAGRKIELGPLEEFPSRLEEIFQPFSEPEGVITIKARKREREKERERERLCLVILIYLFFGFLPKLSVVITNVLLAEIGRLYPNVSTALKSVTILSEGCNDKD